MQLQDGFDGSSEPTRMSLIDYQELISKVNSALPACGITRVIAIDGPAGSGKTTLSYALESNLDNFTVQTIHMDALYQGWDDALTPTLTRTLENQILKPISLGKRAEYRLFDWFEMKPGSTVSFEPPEFLILEGVGSAQAITRKYANFLLWIDVASELGLQRVLDRDGAEIEAQMRKWQLLETDFFERDRTRECATQRIDGNLY